MDKILELEYKSRQYAYDNKKYVGPSYEIEEYVYSPETNNKQEEVCFLRNNKYHII